jgi:tetratricopeptide (TPR) repeat protein
MEDRNGAARYRLLETIRQYARDKLGESGEEEETRDLHSRWYLSFAERAEPELRGPQQTVWLARLDSDHDNFRSALEWLASRANGEAALRLMTGLWRFWFTRGYLREGRGRLEEALARGAGTPPLLRMKALIAAGYLALNQEDYGAAATMLEECLAIGQRLGDRPESAVALNWLGVVAWRRGDFERAESLYARGLALASALGAEDVRIRTLNSLALVTASRCDFAVARELLEECVSAYRRKADKAGVALTTGNLAVMVFRLGDHAAARSIVMESLGLFCELGEVRGMASDLQLLGILAAMRSRPERAARILGAVEAVREAVGAPFAHTERALYDYERYLAVIRGALTEDAFTRAWAEGRGMRLEKAVEYARHDLEIDAAVGRAGHAGPP